jgi:hypothetical protein
VEVVVCREFMERIFPKFQRQNPQLELATELVRGHHPHLRGHYGISIYINSIEASQFRVHIIAHVTISLLSNVDEPITVTGYFQEVWPILMCNKSMEKKNPYISIELTALAETEFCSDDLALKFC